VALALALHHDGSVAAAVAAQPAHGDAELSYDTRLAPLCEQGVRVTVSGKLIRRSSSRSLVM